MTLRFPLLAACLTLASLGGLARTSDAPLPGLRAVVSGETAYLLGDAEQVAGPGVTWADAAPGGRYLLCERRRPLSNAPTVDPENVPVEDALVLWDTKTRKASSLLRLNERPDLDSRLNFLGWSGDSTALVQEFQTSRTDDGKLVEQSATLLVNARGGIQRIPVTPTFIPLTYVHPKLPIIAIQDVSPFGNVALVLNIVRGGVVSKVSISQPGLDTAGWSEDGSRLYLRSYAYDVKREPKRQTMWHALDRAGVLADLPKMPDDLATITERAPLPLTVGPLSSKLTTDKTTEPTKTLWLSTKDGTSKLRVAADIETQIAVILPDLSAVAYRQNGALFAAPLTALDRVAFEELLTRARRKKTVADAKQVGLALMMYCQDYDEMFPPGGANLTETVNPYLRDEGILKGFQFTYAGSSKLADIGKPNETVLGHLVGPGGRAVVFADGHVRWEEG